MKERKKHRYWAEVTWTGNQGRGTVNYRAYERDYQISINNKPVIQGSADPAFLGNPAQYNPEEFLVISLSACHL
ncbi:MAG: OsmC family peroxiredoxin, partial [Cyanobacteria bacterium]|nr:OsmC family peroxiredoxin [Cyanobacteria bacterium GSL.Bin21]